MQTSKIKISIITICYNSDKTIETTILSILKQEYDNLEYIIVDGLSTDNTMHIVNKYQNKISKIISEPDKGISDAFNKGINLATGEIIGIINSDDYLKPGSLKYLSEKVMKDEDVIYGNIIMKSDKSNVYIEYPDLNLSKLSYKMSLFHPSIFIKKRTYNKYGLYNNDFKCVMDRELLLKMYLQGAKFRYLNFEFAVYNMNGKSAQKAFKITLKEDREISVKYGLSKKKATIYYVYRNVKQLILKFLNKIGIEVALRRLKNVIITK